MQFICRRYHQHCPVECLARRRSARAKRRPAFVVSLSLLALHSQKCTSLVKNTGVPPIWHLVRTPSMRRKTALTATYLSQEKGKPEPTMSLREGIEYIQMMLLTRSISPGDLATSLLQWLSQDRRQRSSQAVFRTFSLTRGRCLGCHSRLGNYIHPRVYSLSLSGLWTYWDWCRYVSKL